MSVKSSKSMFQVLRKLADASVPVGAGEVAQALSLPMTTTLRILATLEAAGYAERYEGTSKYVIGRAARTLAFAFLSQFPIRDLALPYLQRLTLESGQTSSLFVRLGWFAVRAATVLGDGVPSQRLAVGEHRNLLEGAPSLVIFAHLNAAEAARATSQAGIVPSTNLDLAVRDVLRDGFLQSPCVFEPTAFDFAVPLFDNHGRAIGSVAMEVVPAGAIADVSASNGPVRQIVAELAARSRGDDAFLMSHYEHVDPNRIQL